MRCRAEARGTVRAPILLAGLLVASPCAAQGDSREVAAATASAPEVTIHFESNRVGTRLLVQRPAGPIRVLIRDEDASPDRYEDALQAYRSVCVAPCDGTLPLGEQRLVLAPEGRGPVLPASAASILGPVTVRGTYEDRRALRIAGWVVFGASVAAGTAMILAAVEHKADSCNGELVTVGNDGTDEVCVEEDSPKNGLLAAGGLVLGVGAVAGVILGLQHDESTIEVTPMPQPLAPTALRREGAVAAMPPPEGAGLRIRF
jgi:hypothetical protein